MCGRYVCTATTDGLMEEFAVRQALGDDLGPSWNVAPTQRVRIVIERDESSAGSAGAAGDDDDPAGATIRELRTIRQLRTVRWGLVPHWAKDPSIGNRMINARSETVATKPAFRVAAARRRCLVPASGYYEWMSGPTAKSRKTPYFLHPADDSTLAFAGLYEIWRDPTLPDDHPEHARWTCTIITRSAPDALGHIHDRSPVVVPRGMHSAWLDCGDADVHAAEALLAAVPPPSLVPREVGSAVGNVRNNAADLIAPATPPDPRPHRPIAR